MNKPFIYNIKNIPLAKKLRQSQTDTKKFLWSKLQIKQVGGYKFYRQYPIDTYILDFIAHPRNLQSNWMEANIRIRLNMMKIVRESLTD